MGDEVHGGIGLEPGGGGPALEDLIAPVMESEITPRSGTVEEGDRNHEEIAGVVGEIARRNGRGDGTIGGGGCEKVDIVEHDNRRRRRQRPEVARIGD